MTVVATQLLVLFSFIIAGYILKKKNVVNFQTSSMLSKLELFLFCPSVTIRSFALNLNMGNLKEKYVYFIASVCIIIFTIAGAKLLARLLTKDRYERGVYSYNFTTGNYGYMGYPLMQGLFGDDMLLNMIIFSIPVSIYVYTEGYRVLTGGHKPNLKSILSSPFLIAIAIGLAIGLSGIKLPDWIESVLTNSANCMAPVAMIITGIVLAEYDILPLLKNFKIYIASFIRLVAIPLILIFVLRLLGLEKEVITVAVFFYAVPAGLNPVIFPNAMGRDCKPGLSMVLITNILCLATIPFIVSII